MVNHNLFIAWAFNRHCSAPHNADFEVCQDKACVRARGYENDKPSVQAEELAEKQNETMVN